MKANWRKALAAVLVLVMLFAMTACGGEKPKEESTPAPAAETAAPTPAATAETTPAATAETTPAATPVPAPAGTTDNAGAAFAANEDGTPDLG